MQKLSDKEKENALNEVRILASIRHPNIVAYREAFIDDPSQSLCIVMEYANSGDLFQQICDHQKNNTLFKEEDIWKIFIQMVRGLRCLHEILIFHRDLKSANVFLNKDGSAKLGDMNVSKVAKKGMLYTQTGTPYYASPEVWRDQPYDNKSDIWSLGCVLYESITLKPPFRADDMQGLYKKVLRGVYPKIPNIYSTDLGNLVKSLVQVTPQMRPSCERILEMPIVKRRIEKLFPTDEFYDSQSSLLNTIRVPKNLLYLTDRLPKPSYDSPSQKRKMDEEERIRRKTHDAGNMLPDIKNQARKSKGESSSQQPQNSQYQQQITSQQTGGGKRSRRQNTKPAVARGRSDLREGSQLQEGYQPEDGGAGPATAKGNVSQAEDDRRSVVSKNSISQQQTNVSQKQQDVPPALRKNSTKSKVQQQHSISISQRLREQQTHDSKNDGGIHEEYDEDQFERDQSPLPKILPSQQQQQQQEESSYLNNESPSSPPQYQMSVSPQTKRSNVSKAQQPISQQQMPNPQMMLLSNRPQVNYSVNNALSSGGNNSPERIGYVQKGPAPLPSLVESGAPNQQSRKNLAYINISGEGAKPVGYLGLKKAEKDLIMRRYKYNHHVSDHIQRVAMIYGNSNVPGGGGSVGAPGVSQGSQQQYQYNYSTGGGSGNSITNQNNIYSPYLANQMAINNQNQSNSLSGIIKRNKYAPQQQVIEESASNGQAAIRLPKLNGSNNNRQQLDHSGMNQQSQAMLPPLGGQSIGSIPSVNGTGLISKAQMQIYQPYMVKPSKLKSIPKPLLGPSQGISGEKININKYGSGSVAPMATGGVSQLNGGSSSLHEQHPQPVSRTNQLQALGQSNSAGGGAGPTPSQGGDIKKIYKKRQKNLPQSTSGAASIPAAVPTRNISGGGLGGETNGGGNTSLAADQNAFD